MSFAKDDTRAKAVLHELSGTFEVVWTRSSRFGRRRLAALQEAIAQCDAFLAVLPPRGIAGRSDVTFEIGLAVSANQDIVISGHQFTPPRALSELAFVPIAAVVDFVIARQGEERDFHHGYSSVFDGKSELMHSVPLHSGGDSLSLVMLESRTRELLSAAGAEVARADIRSDGPDLVVWEDSLATSFGLPLAVECTSSATETSRWDRFKRILRQSGSPTLLVVTSSAGRARSWTDGASSIISVSFSELESTLEECSINEALLIFVGAER